MKPGDVVTYSGKRGKMRVNYIGETRVAKTTKGSEVSLEKGKEYECSEKEYHSGLFVLVTTPSGERVRVKRSELQKV